MALADGVTRTLFTGKLKAALAVLLAVGFVAGGAGVLARQALATGERPGEGQKAEVRSSEPAAAREAAKPPAADVKDSIAYGGRVLGPDGRPVAGARLHMTLAWGYPHRPSPSPVYATTGPDGRFRFTVPKAEFGDQFTVVAAAAANHGVGWVQVPAGGRTDDLLIRLVEDDVPITGQVLDLEGKPVPGATLTVMQINAAPGDDLGPWLEATRARKGLSLQIEQQYLKRFTIAVTLQATTDAQGRLRLTGIGRNRLVRAQLDGPTIVTQQLCILRRPGEAIAVTEHEGNPEYNEPRKVTTYQGASFRLVAAPTKPVVGVVRARDSKKPLAGVTVGSHTQAIGPGRFRSVDMLRTTTDAEGRYRLTGLPKGEGLSLMVIPRNDQPYLRTHQDVPNSPGLDPVTVDFELSRGIWIEGKVSDKGTGKPLRVALEYFSLYRNPNLRDYPRFDGTFSWDGNGVSTNGDGSYRVVGVPGPGLIAVYPPRGPYLRADERDDEFGAKERSLETAPYHISFTSNYGALARVNPAKGVDAVTRDVTLDPGWTFTGTVLGPDGKPLAGARTLDLNAHWWGYERLKTAEFAGGFNPRRPCDVLVQHPEKGLVGVAHPPREKAGSVTVRMEPGATVVGRLVDAAGKPRAAVELQVTFLPGGWGSWLSYPAEPVPTDREGRFRIEMLLPGYKFRLSDGRGGVLPFGDDLASGRTRELGDVRMKQAEE
jgi:protocatechuate 3,4-dioxygenase beta subunit